MTKIQKFTLGIIFTFFSINMLGCSDGKTTVSSPPTIQISPTLDFNFGTVTEGNIVSPLEVIITNIGGERLDISSIAISDSVNFQLDPNSGTKPCINFSTALPAGESCTVEITFTPILFDTSPTALATALEINSNDPITPKKTLNLAGTSEQVSSTLNVTINQVDTATCPDVVAYVSVTDQSNFPVAGLLSADFSITEVVNGVDIVASLTSSTVGDVNDTIPISIAVVMDNSSSMQDIDIAEMNQAAIDVVGLMTDADKAEIIKFNQTVSIVQAFTNNKNLLTTAINTPFDGSGTALYEALQRAINDTDLISGRKAIIVITDGENTIDTSATLTGIINDAQAKSIPIFVIALGSFDQTIIDNVLAPIANDTSGEFYEADVAQNFSTIIEQQLTEVLFIDQYILNYNSGSSGSGTDVNLTIDVDNSDGLTGTDSKLVTPCPL